MPSYNDFVMRHGEFGVQALIERLERYDGVRVRLGVSLEQRWDALMAQDNDNAAVTVRNEAVAVRRAA